MGRKVVMVAKGYKEYYFEGDRDCCLITMYENGEVCIASSKKAVWSKTLLGRQDGHLPQGWRTSNTAMLRQCLKVIKYHASSTRLWYEATDDRRATVYKRAFERAGLTVVVESATVSISS